MMNGTLIMKPETDVTGRSVYLLNENLDQYPPSLTPSYAHTDRSTVGCADCTSVNVDIMRNMTPNTTCNSPAGSLTTTYGNNNNNQSRYKISPNSYYDIDSVNPLRPDSDLDSAFPPKRLYTDDIPVLDSFPGYYGFDLYRPLCGDSYEASETKPSTAFFYFKDEQGWTNLYAKKTPTWWTLSYWCQRKPPDGSFIRLTPVYGASDKQQEVIQRCFEDFMGMPTSGMARYSIVMVGNSLAEYFFDPTTERLCVTLPYETPKEGCEYSQFNGKFMCFNSCLYNGGQGNKKPLFLIITLERMCSGSEPNKGICEVLGRQCIKFRSCACPKRDKENNERRTTCDPVIMPNLGKRRKETNDRTGDRHNSKRAKSNVIQNTINTNGSLNVNPLNTTTNNGVNTNNNSNNNNTGMKNHDYRSSVRPNLGMEGKDHYYSSFNPWLCSPHPMGFGEFSHDDHHCIDSSQFLDDPTDMAFDFECGGGAGGIHETTPNVINFNGETYNLLLVPTNLPGALETLSGVRFGLLKSWAYWSIKSSLNKFSSPKQQTDMIGSIIELSKGDIKTLNTTNDLSGNGHNNNNNNNNNSNSIGSHDNTLLTSKSIKSSDKMYDVDNRYFSQSSHYQAMINSTLNHLNKMEHHLAGLVRERMHLSGVYAQTHNYSGESTDSQPNSTISTGAVGFGVNGLDEINPINGDYFQAQTINGLLNTEANSQLQILSKNTQNYANFMHSSLYALSTSSSTLSLGNTSTSSGLAAAAVAPTTTSSSSSSTGSAQQSNSIIYGCAANLNWSYDLDQMMRGQATQIGPTNVGCDQLYPSYSNFIHQAVGNGTSQASKILDTYGLVHQQLPQSSSPVHYSMINSALVGHETNDLINSRIQQEHGSAFTTTVKPSSLNLIVNRHHHHQQQQQQNSNSTHSLINIDNNSSNNNNNSNNSNSTCSNKTNNVNHSVTNNSNTTTTNNSNNNNNNNNSNNNELSSTGFYGSNQYFGVSSNDIDQSNLMDNVPGSHLPLLTNCVEQSGTNHINLSNYHNISPVSASRNLTTDSSSIMISDELMNHCLDKKKLAMTN